MRTRRARGRGIDCARDMRVYVWEVFAEEVED